MYYYQCGDASIRALSDIVQFKTMPRSGPRSYPSRIGVVGDLGLTYNMTSTISQMMRNDPDVIVLVGDVCYANMYLTNGTGSDCYSCSFSQTPIHETYQPRWDYWGRCIPSQTLFLYLLLCLAVFNYCMHLQTPNYQGKKQHI